eukprot:gnl/TRDRNA2_/TRDRNA2_32718_c0_seq1.p1 gnl/TRDRNA2_/TRDRNA2_32718_c0~~gnl/TRDRNA2_/TRDRNA2_32718_c0_seq1.p1  ORF type:complete len:229 (+),score=33.40 gnl/TRDRNA2_/TRDRNA2_32718_c0_seq1:46-732(+)
MDNNAAASLIHELFNASGRTGTAFYDSQVLGFPSPERVESLKGNSPGARAALHITVSDAEADLAWQRHLAVALGVALVLVCGGLVWNVRQLCRTLRQERHVRNFRPRPGDGLSEAALARLMPEPAPPPGDAEGERSTECCVCLLLIDEGSSSLRLPCCARLYHHECLIRWLAVMARCPMCRQPVLASGGDSAQRREEADAETTGALVLAAGATEERSSLLLPGDAHRQ